MRAPKISSLLAVATISLLGGCQTAATEQRNSAESIQIVGPVEYAAAPVGQSYVAHRIGALADIDPASPSADDNAGQILSLFGREDLIAATSSDYKATNCVLAETTPDVLSEIERRARDTSVVIINESHERSEHRGFTADVIRRLRPLGYDTLALEALSNPKRDSPVQFLPSFVRFPDLPYFEEDDGFYLSEPAFGRLGRLAKTLGYRLLPYEAQFPAGERALPLEQQIALREEGQAGNLLAFLQSHPGAKIVVHVGYSHATEVPQASGRRWMATRLKAKSGIDPLTISQTTCRGGDAVSPRLAILPASQPAGQFDLVINHPEARFEGGRPAWRTRAGDKAFEIPEEAYPAAGWRVVEARPIGEPATSVPMDRVAIRPGERVALMLPPGRYALKVIDVPRHQTSRDASRTGH